MIEIEKNKKGPEANLDREIEAIDGKDILESKELIKQARLVFKNGTLKTKCKMSIRRDFPKGITVTGKVERETKTAEMEIAKESIAVSKEKENRWIAMIGGKSRFNGIMDTIIAFLSSVKEGSLTILHNPDEAGRLGKLISSLQITITDDSNQNTYPYCAEFSFAQIEVNSFFKTFSNNAERSFTLVSRESVGLWEIRVLKEKRERILPGSNRYIEETLILYPQIKLDIKENRLWLIKDFYNFINYKRREQESLGNKTTYNPTRGRRNYYRGRGGSRGRGMRRGRSRGRRGR